MNHPLVIGYGNTLRQDDGLGWRAAELLESQTAPGLARVLKCRQLLPELAAELEGAPVVLFLDAALDLAPGTVVVKRISADRQTVWSHDLSAAQLTGLAEMLFGRQQPAFQITGGVQQAGYKDQLTPAGEQCARRMAAAATELLLFALHPAAHRPG